MVMADIKVPKKMLDKEKSEERGEAAQADLQNEVILYQLLQRQLGQLGAEAEAIERRAVEAAATKQSLKELDKPKEMLVPIGSNCYVQGKFFETDKILVDVGSGVLLPKNKTEANSFLSGREAEIAKLKADLQSSANKLIAELNRIATKVNK
jgi:prefoldin alpha subunit